jgi:hypothetical protein
MSWVAGALVFSGRPDPSWPVDDALGVELEQLWLSLAPAAGEAGERPPPLGYRGCFLAAADGRRWTAYRGRVALEMASLTEVRPDPDMKFEAMVLASAPPGMLPPWVPDRSVH